MDSDTPAARCTATPVGAALLALARRLSTGFGVAGSRLRRKTQQLRDAQDLPLLSDHLLRDIGVRRGESGAGIRQGAHTAPPGAGGAV